MKKISVRNYQPHGTLSSLEVTRRNPTSKLVSITVRPLSFRTKRKHSAEARGTVVGKTVGGETGWQMGHFGWMIRRLKKPPCSWWRWQLMKVSVYPDRKEKPDISCIIKWRESLFQQLRTSKVSKIKLKFLGWEGKKSPHQNPGSTNNICSNSSPSSALFRLVNLTPFTIPSHQKTTPLPSCRSHQCCSRIQGRSLVHKLSSCDVDGLTQLIKEKQLPVSSTLTGLTKQAWLNQNYYFNNLDFPTKLPTDSQHTVCLQSNVFPSLYDQTLTNPSIPNPPRIAPFPTALVSLCRVAEANEFTGLKGQR